MATERGESDDRHTGRWLVALGRRPVRQSVQELRRLGFRDAATSSDFGGAAVPGTEALLLERLGVAVVPGRSADGSVLAARTGVRRERERWVHAAGRAPGPVPVGPVPAGTVPAGPASVGPAPVGPGPVGPVPAGGSWALAALGGGSGLDGTGVRVAVLDTGVDATHPDLAGRVAAAVSLVPGESANDVAGHGTHCAGLVCGDPAYAVAPGAALYAGKVLDPSGSGREADVLAGVEWAVEQGCRVISMSLSAPGGGAPSRVFEQVAADLLDEGIILVAAVGNDSERSRGYVSPIGRPASCPTVVAVGAVDRDLAVADFSNGGARLDLVAPGVDVVSAWPGGGHRADSGTSMAAPHVAGVLALLLQDAGDRSARGAVRRLLDTARRVDGPRSAVGAGLVQRP